MAKYKVIVLDLDGTLTNDAKVITPKTKAALLEAQHNGVTVILASGRPTYGIRTIADELEIGRFGGYVMAYNGGYVCRWADKAVVTQLNLPANTVPALYRLASDAGCEILTYQGQRIAATSVRNKYVMHESFINKMPIVHYADFVNQVVHPISKCLIVGDPKILINLEHQVNEQMAGRVSAYRSAGFFLECVPPGIDKAAALSGLLQTINISRDEVIAVGDGYNDLSMIEYAGLGVAMANAAREVQDAADYITYSNQEDGVAHVVEKFILRRKEE